ncbi:hypothetical protein ABHF91_04935 [Pseudaeromonas sp. ZJS20]|uniref:hypothetical protein n=1 Tax=Pseudaeromonas aegiceratis TaxID=3153928 RepID=UPI00390C82E5
MAKIALIAPLLLALAPWSHAADLTGKTTLGETWYWTDDQEYLAPPPTAAQEEPPIQTHWFWNRSRDLDAQHLTSGLEVKLPFGLAISSSLHQLQSAPYHQIFWQLGSAYRFAPDLQLQAHYRLQSPSGQPGSEPQQQVDLGIHYRF